ncbi:MAG: hypothetical protein ABIT76_05090 [Chthoniobacterales bacterium]
MKWQPIFSTPRLRAQDWVLPSMILGAVFIHGMAFYLVQASVPEPEKKLIASARLTVLDPNNSRDLPVLEWIENHDPAAIAFQSESPQPPHLFDTPPYQPSYEKVLPEPLPVLRETNSLHHQSFFPPGPVPDFQSNVGTVTKKVAILTSKVVPSPSIELDFSRPFSPPAINGELPTPAQFLITSAGPYGEKAFFLLQSSGHDELDSYARQWLMASQVALKNSQTSGWVQIHWGGEIWKKAAP